MIPEAQGPVYLGCLSIRKTGLGLGRDVRVGDEVFHGFDGLGKTLDCTPAADGSGTSLCSGLMTGTMSLTAPKLYRIASRGRRPSHAAHMRAKRAVTNEVASNPFEKVALAGRPIWPEYQDPYDQAYWGKGKGKKGKKGKSKFQYPYDGNKGYPSYDNAKGKSGQDRGKSKTFAAIAERRQRNSPPSSKLHHPQTLPTPVGQIKIGIHHGIGGYPSHETPSAGQAMMAFHDC